MASQFSKIPYKWFDYSNRLGLFVTYWGDIFTGFLYELPDYSDGFFVVPFENARKINETDPKLRSADLYKELGHEITDYRVIIEHFEISPSQKLFQSSDQPAISTSGQVFRDMFVFGAGASTHCCFSEHKDKLKKEVFCPPLGYDIFNERFNEILTKYKGVNAAIPQFELKGNTIEECLENDWHAYTKMFLPELVSRHINIQFYLQELFQEISKFVVTNYKRKNCYQVFADRLLTKTASDDNYRPVIVNFNYDTILDQFLEDTFRYVFRNLKDYVDWENKRVVLFKPHGSCNWGWKLNEDSLDFFGNNLASKLYEVQTDFATIFYNYLGKNYDSVSSNSYGYEMHFNSRKVGKYSLDKQKIEICKPNESYPALLVPFKEKDEFVMPYHHQFAMSRAITDVERLFVIGWKGSEQLFLDQLAKANRIKEVIIVNPEYEEVKTLLEKNIKTNCAWTKIEDFETFIRTDII